MADNTWCDHDCHAGRPDRRLDSACRFRCHAREPKRGGLLDSTFDRFRTVFAGAGGVISYLVLTIKAFNLNRRQSNFVDSVTHELKSPIASLKLCLQTLGRHNVSVKERETFFQYMLDDVERLDGLITHLLAAGNIEFRREKADSEIIDLPELITEIATSAMQRHHLPEDAIRLQLAPCRVLANRIDLDMIVRNLVENAIKYGGTPLQSEVSLSLDKNIHLRIDDNGGGIPRGQRNRVFGRFVRLGSELERTQKGTGLGLYIVRTLVDRLGGEVSATESPLNGARFEVRFPMSLMGD